MQTPAYLNAKSEGSDLKMTEPDIKKSGAASTFDHIQRHTEDYSAGQLVTQGGHPESPAVVCIEQLQLRNGRASWSPHVQLEDMTMKSDEAVEVNENLDDEDDNESGIKQGSLATFSQTGTPMATPVTPVTADNCFPESGTVDVFASNTVEIINSPTLPAKKVVSSVSIHLQSQSSEEQEPQQHPPDSHEQEVHSFTASSHSSQKEGHVHRYKDVIRVRQESIPYIEIKETEHNLDIGYNREESLKEQDVPDSDGHLPEVEMPSKFEEPEPAKSTPAIVDNTKSDLRLPTKNTTNQSRHMTRTPSIIQCASTVPLPTNLYMSHQIQASVSDPYHTEDSETNEHPTETSSWWTTWLLWTIPIALIMVTGAYHLRNSRS